MNHYNINYDVLISRYLNLVMLIREHKHEMKIF